MMTKKLIRIKELRDVTKFHLVFILFFYSFCVILLYHALFGNTIGVTLLSTTFNTPSHRRNFIFIDSQMNQARLTIHLACTLSFVDYLGDNTTKTLNHLSRQL